MAIIIAINLIFIFKIVKAYWVVISKRVKSAFRSLKSKILAWIKKGISTNERPEETPQFCLSSERNLVQTNLNNDDEDFRSMDKFSDQSSSQSEDESIDESVLYVRVNKAYLQEEDEEEVDQESED